MTGDDINRRIVDSSEDCLKILDLDGRIVYVNSAGVRHMDLGDPADMVGRTWLEFWEPEDRDAARAALACARGGGRGTFQGVSKTVLGVPKFWDVAVTPITNGGGEVLQFLAVARDLTDRRREEAFRNAQHELLEKIATAAPLEDILTNLVRLLERQCDGMRCSVALVDETGAFLRNGIAPSLPGLYGPEAVPIGPQSGSCGTAVHLGKPVIVADVLSDPLWEDYRHLPLMYGFRACWSMPILSSERKVLGAFAMYANDARQPRRDEIRMLDIAAYIAGIAIERQQSVQALRQSEERVRAILRAIPDWIFVTSMAGVILDYHVKDVEALFVPPAAFVGRPIPEVLPPAVADVLLAAHARAIGSDEPQKVEYSIGAEDQERFFEATVVRCSDDTMLSIVRDITDRRRAEVAVATQRHELAHLSRVAMLGELSGALAHELSQPLTAILSNAQTARRLLERDSPDLPEVLDTLEDIIRNDKRAGAVIDRLRTFLKKGSIARQRLDVTDVTREVLDLVRSDLLARRVSLTTRFSPSLPSVLGDRIQLQQVVLNLVLNACDAMADTPMRERQLSVETAVDGEFVEIVVTDRGTGIPAGQLDAVFEPFVTFRAHGLGLGLAISRSIVMAHGGRILASNNDDGGVTFRCLLPAAHIPAQEIS